MSTTGDDRVVVIGSGPTGAVAAANLVQRGIPVTMLDAGTHAPRGLLVRAAGNTVLRLSSKAEMTWARTADATDDEIDWGSSLSLGGLSNYWTGAVPRFAPSDFTEGALVDERYEWPVSYEDLATHYDAVERIIGITAGRRPIAGIPPGIVRHPYSAPADWQELIEAADHAGHAVGELPMAKGDPWMVVRRAREFASYHCVVAPLVGGGSFELITGAHVTALRPSAAGDRIEAVEYVDAANGQRRTIGARAVVVAAGAIDSTVLLLRSRSDRFPAGLGNSTGVVGRYLHDHPREWWPAEVDRPMRALAHPIYVAREPAATNDPPLLATSLTIGLGGRFERLRTYYRGRSRAIGVQVFGTMVPDDTVGVSLCGDDRDATGDRRPLISLHFDARTRANLTSARQRLRDVFADAGSDVSVAGPFHDLRPGSAVHYGGTVRMHRSPEFGALDAWNRLHEIPSVLVVDSSAFTTGPEKNPTLTAMALAHRATTRLADDLADGTAA
ncbi:MAG: GMC oxidoreductase [Ilumatobacteraceae bacterium]